MAPTTTGHKYDIIMVPTSRMPKYSLHAEVPSSVVVVGHFYLYSLKFNGMSLIFIIFYISYYLNILFCYSNFSQISCYKNNKSNCNFFHKTTFILQSKTSPSSPEIDFSLGTEPVEDIEVEPDQSYFFDEKVGGFDFSGITDKNHYYTDNCYHYNDNLGRRSHRPAKFRISLRTRH